MPVINRGIVKKKAKAKPKPSTRKVTTLADLAKKKQKPKPKPSSSIRKVTTLADLAKSEDNRKQAGPEEPYDEDYTLGDETTDEEPDRLPGRKSDLVLDKLETLNPDGSIEVIKVPVRGIAEDEERVMREAQAEEDSELVRARRLERFSAMFEATLSSLALPAPPHDQGPQY